MHARPIPALAALILLSGATAHATRLLVTTSGAEPPQFVTADLCMACHNGLVAASGEDVSIGVDWRASMMANSARDPYWQAAVRREIIDHPAAAEAIENECSRCHMPMASEQARARGETGSVFAHLPVTAATNDEDLLAADGVSCSLCHQITAERLGTDDSFTGGFVIDTVRHGGHGRAFGPFIVDTGRITIMRSATGFRPTAADHIRTSEVCATCHTLYTHALGPDGSVIARLPEQVPYQEWLNSAYRGERTCQDCHMETVVDSVAISSVLGVPRVGMKRHTFVGGNFFMLRMLNRYRDDLGVTALPQELDAAAHRTETFLRTQTARLAIERTAMVGSVLAATIAIENLSGHKLPTAYPSRRAWLHVTVRDRSGRIVFESGALRNDGSIAGNDNDADPARYEPHHTVIESPDQVQVYESIMVGADDALTTGLLTGVRYIKDNRILPRGFDKASAPADVAVHGRALADDTFRDGSDRVRYQVNVAGAEGPFRIDAALLFQPISFRWAHNLRPYDAFETNRFLAWYEAMAAHSATVLGHTAATIE